MASWLCECQDPLGSFSDCQEDGLVVCTSCGAMRPDPVLVDEQGGLSSSQGLPTGKQPTGQQAVQKTPRPEADLSAEAAKQLAQAEGLPLITTTDNTTGYRCVSTNGFRQGPSEARGTAQASALRLPKKIAPHW